MKKNAENAEGPNIKENALDAADSCTGIHCNRDPSDVPERLAFKRSRKLCLLSLSLLVLVVELVFCLVCGSDENKKTKSVATTKRQRGSEATYSRGWYLTPPWAIGPRRELRDMRQEGAES